LHSFVVCTLHSFVVCVFWLHSFVVCTLHSFVVCVLVAFICGCPRNSWPAHDVGAHGIQLLCALHSFVVVLSFCVPGERWLLPLSFLACWCYHCCIEQSINSRMWDTEFYQMQCHSQYLPFVGSIIIHKKSCIILEKGRKNSNNNNKTVRTNDDDIANTVENVPRWVASTSSCVSCWVSFGVDKQHEANI